MLPDQSPWTITFALYLGVWVLAIATAWYCSKYENKKGKDKNGRDSIP